MADIGEKIQPLVDAVVEPGETVEGACVGSRTKFMAGKFVTLVTTNRRVITQETDRKFQTPKGEPLSLPPGRIASAKVGGAGGFGGDPQPAILNRPRWGSRSRPPTGRRPSSWWAGRPGCSET